MECKGSKGATANEGAKLRKVIFIWHFQGLSFREMDNQPLTDVFLEDNFSCVGSLKAGELHC